MHKRLRMSLVICILLAGVIQATASDPHEIPKHLQGISVTVVAKPQSGDTSYGSGTIRTLTPAGDDEPISFVLTAAHVLEKLRSVRDVIAADGTPRKQVVFEDAAVVQELRQDGEHVGELRMYAKVFAYDAEADIAVLWIKKRSFIRDTLVFYGQEEIPSPGTPIWHTGSPGGPSIGPHSLTDGVVSQIGRRVEISAKLQDQGTYASLPGSSGGGVFRREDGQYIGLHVVGVRDADSFSYYIPVRSIRQWAKAIDLEWFLTGEKVPTVSELEKVPAERSGRKFERPDSEKKDATEPAAQPVLRMHEVFPHG